MGLVLPLPVVAQQVGVRCGMIWKLLPSRAACCCGRRGVWRHVHHYYTNKQLVSVTVSELLLL